MAVEIERKFLLVSDKWREQVSHSILFRQGYLTQNNANNEARSSVRVRVEGDNANLNIKSMTLGIQRLEYEYAIPLIDANEMLDKLCAEPLIEKTRHYVQFGEHTWEIDEFMGDNAGLIVAEIELATEDESFARSDWLGDEVSQHERYYNVCLTNYPYSQWTAAERAGR